MKKFSQILQDKCDQVEEDDAPVSNTSSSIATTGLENKGKKKPKVSTPPEPV